MTHMHARSWIVVISVAAAGLVLPAAPATRVQAAAQAPATAALGYYRFPAIFKDTIVFTAEGDLWKVGIQGGIAQRLTTHPAEESRPAFSADGKTIAFSASYEGPTEVYTLALDGGVPVRRTYEGGTASVVGWTPSGRILYSTRRFSTLPNTQLATVDPKTGVSTLLPLSQASDGGYDTSGRTLYFTRLAFQGSYTKRYQGGTAQNVWRFTDGDKEATPLTGDYAGTSKSPMLWQGRLYFLSDRDGTMNLWSMAEAGGDLRQHTNHSGFDASSPSLSEGRIAYQLAGDLRVYDITRNEDRAVPVSLVSDFDQLRERWVRTPMEWVTAMHLSPTGDRVVLTARGQLFVAPAQQGRIVEATRDKKTRYREGRFFPDGKSLLGLSDASGEVEFWRVPANGVGDSTQLTTDGTVLRWNGIASPDGSKIAHFDKDQQLWVFDVATKQQKKVAVCDEGGFDDVTWSPDGKFLAYTAPDRNQMTRLYLYEPSSARITPVSSDRYDTYSPEWSPDGKWLYFLSDRNFVSVVQSPWGSRQPEPFFDKQTSIYLVSMKPNERSPFQPDDELYTAPRQGQGQGQERREVRPRQEGTRGQDEIHAGAEEAVDSAGAERQARAACRHGPGGNRDAAPRGAAAAGELFGPLERRQAPLFPVARCLGLRAAGAQDARHREQEPEARNFQRRGLDVRALARSEEDPDPQGRGFVRVRRRRQGAAGSLQEQGAARRLGLPPGSAGRVAADVHRGVAARARLFLRPGDARRRLDGDEGEVPAARRPRDRSRRAQRHSRRRWSGSSRRSTSSCVVATCGGGASRSSPDRSAPRSRGTRRPAASASSTSTSPTRTFPRSSRRSRR